MEAADFKKWRPMGELQALDNSSGGGM